MKKHKWHKEIKAWADGAEIEYRKKTGYGCIALDWVSIGEQESIDWSMNEFEFRIKPQSKEPQYLCVWKPYDSAEDLIISDVKANGIFDDGIYKLIGKIKLEQDE